MKVLASKAKQLAEVLRFKASGGYQSDRPLAGHQQEEEITMPPSRKTRKQQKKGIRQEEEDPGDHKITSLSSRSMGLDLRGREDM